MSDALDVTQWWEVRWDDCDEAHYWYGYCEGDKDGDREPVRKPISFDPTVFPVGTRIKVLEPDDPKFYSELNDRLR